MSLVLHSHPLASFCHKVLIALYENGTPFEARLVDLSDRDERAGLAALWPVGKIPLLEDTARGVVMPETSIIIEYLDRHRPGPQALIPADPDAALDARLWDRFFDTYVHVPMQKIVIDRLRPEGAADPHGVAEARAALRLAYGMIERRMAGRTWAAGDAFGIADCAATPALFYAATLEPFDGLPALTAYFERLVARPSVVRVIDEAQPWFQFYPYRNAIPARFWPPDT